MPRSPHKGRTTSAIKGARKGSLGRAHQDVVNRPAHYTFSIEVIDAIESWGLGYHLGNVVKYVARAAHKGAQAQDLKKARWYLERVIKRLEGGR